MVIVFLQIINTGHDLHNSLISDKAHKTDQRWHKLNRPNSKSPPTINYNSWAGDATYARKLRVHYEIENEFLQVRWPSGLRRCV